MREDAVRRNGGVPGGSASLERRLRTAIEQSPLAMHVFSPDGNSLLVNAAWDRLWNLTTDERSEDRNIFEDEQLRASGLLPYVYEALDGEAVTTPALLYDPGRVGRKEHPIWLRALAYPVRSEDAEGVSEVTLIIEDITEQKELEEKLSHRAFHDDLTGLANRALLKDRLGHALERAWRVGAEGGQSLALLFMDLDNFKHVNDSLGHQAGDELLVEVARRLRGCTRPQDTVARLGGDEFVVLLEDVAGPDAAGKTAARVAAALRAPLRLRDREVFVTASIGIVPLGAAVGPEETTAELLRAADVAMYSAKKAGKDRHLFFEPSMDGASDERLTLEGGLRRALEREEFVVFYQPLIGVASGAVTGYEALVRWRHPERGIVSPPEFVPLAEETGLIVAMGHQVLAAACATARRLARKSLGGGPPADPQTVWINLSPRQLREAGLTRRVEAALREHDLGPGSLGVEITESVAMDGVGPGIEATAEVLQGLKDLGVGVAIDDFGTGYSSLSYLKRLPVDVLKIDRSFVSGLADGSSDRGDAAIVSAVVTLAHDMGLRTVGEGVETERQIERLRERGCDEVQGFLLGKPLPVGPGRLPGPSVAPRENVYIPR